MSNEMGRRKGYSPLGRSESTNDHTIRITNTSWDNLQTIAKISMMSRSALIDLLLSGVITAKVLGDKIAITVTGNNSIITIELGIQPIVGENLINGPRLFAIFQPPTETIAPPPPPQTDTTT